MNRLNRITAILLQVQSRRSVRVQDLAERYAVHARTIYRDLRTLEEAGVPLLSVPGGGFSLAEGYRLPPVMFTREEVTALITAEKLAEQFTDAPTARFGRAAMDKLRAVLRSADRAYVEDLTPRIAVHHRGHEGGPQPVAADHDTRQTLLNGVSNRQVVRLDYRAGAGAVASARAVEPIGLYFDLHWQLVAYCRLRQALRTFRLDRIAGAELLPERFAPRPDTLQTYREQQRAPRHRVVLRFSAAGLLLVRDDKHYYGLVEEQPLADGGAQLTLLLPALRPLAHWLLYFGAQVTIVEPAELRRTVLELAGTAWHHHAVPDEAPTAPPGTGASA
ncbi:helix-turn-helix transcriptional regulator [Hymenobacter sp. B81]|uniref:helix-turn-helix transcriptional regulator n=1 Tax=Hymenobacter sp. B81 TaxID=3344878 RepID=UPI0037DC44DD